MRSLSLIIIHPPTFWQEGYMSSPNGKYLTNAKLQTNSLECLDFSICYGILLSSDTLMSWIQVRGRIIETHDPACPFYKLLYLKKEI